MTPVDAAEVERFKADLDEIADDPEGIAFVSLMLITIRRNDRPLLRGIQELAYAERRAGEPLD